MQSQTYFIVVLSDIRNRYQMLDQIYIAFSFFCVLLYVFYFEAESMIEMIQYVGVVWEIVKNIPTVRPRFFFRHVHSMLSFVTNVFPVHVETWEGLRV